MDGSGEDQMIIRGSGEVQMRVKSQKYSELDIGGHETCLTFGLETLEFFYGLDSGLQTRPLTINQTLKTFL